MSTTTITVEWSTTFQADLLIPHEVIGDQKATDLHILKALKNDIAVSISKGANVINVRVVADGRAEGKPAESKAEVTIEN